MNIYACSGFTGHYPVGTAAVVTAETSQDASRLLNAKLRDKELPGDSTPEDMILIVPGVEAVMILLDGNY